MLRNNHQQPAVLPILSRGKHRSPRKGACFMEFASLLGFRCILRAASTSVDL